MEVDNSKNLKFKQKAQIIEAVRDKASIGMMNIKECCEWADWDVDLAIKRAEYWPYEWTRGAIVDFWHTFRYFTDNFEMEIFSKDGKTFDVNYPRYDILGNEGKEVHFVKMNYIQISMLLFAYDSEELECFKTSLERWLRKEIECKCSKCVFHNAECELGIKGTLDCEMFRKPAGITVREFLGDMVEEAREKAVELGKSMEEFEEMLNKDMATQSVWGRCK